MKKILLLFLFATLTLGVTAQNVWLKSVKFNTKTGTVWQKEFSDCNVDICITQYDSQNNVTFYDKNSTGYNQILCGWSILKCVNMAGKNGIITSTLSCINDRDETVKIIITTTTEAYKKIRLIYKNGEIVYIIDHIIP